MDKLKYIKLENEDGSYTDSIPLAVDSDYVDVNGSTLTSTLGTLATKTEVQAVASGSPAGVYATVAALTTADPDHSKIYVVTADGHWYYYNGGWQDGGMYQASNNILGIYGTSTININNYEELLPDLNNAQNDIVYVLLFANANNAPANLPIKPSSHIETLISIKTGISKVQLYFSEKNIFQRRLFDGVWSSWVKIGNLSNYDLIDNISKMSDLNNADEGVYQLLFASNVNYPSNLPVVPNSTVDTLICYKSLNCIRQIYINNSDIYVRFKYAAQEWRNWVKITNKIPDYLHNNIINLDNYESKLPDLNTVSDGDYMLLFANENNCPANLPIAPSSKIEYLHSFTTTDEISKYQIYMTDNKIYSRWKYDNQNWRDWKKVSDLPPTFYVGANKEFTSLKDGIAEAIKYSNSTVYVDEGIYDLYEEFGGNDYFDNYDSSSAIGIILSNNVHVVFSEGAKVVFNYNGNNDAIKLKFSPFNAGSKGFTLENCNIIAKNCRYCVHDEKGGTNDKYINKYINCNFELDNTNNTQSSGSCIGCGLGHDGTIIIDSCILKTLKNTTNPATLFFHNNFSDVDTSAKSKVIIKNNYFKTGTIRARWCGVSTEITDFLICNNKLNSAIQTGQERPQDVIENIAIYEINNVIAS